ncbi:hypothetical protein ACOSQ2_019260 [Xanthoceras sorbifolium]
MSGEEKEVCVTEASGYIASWLVKQLHQHGYTVKATVRDPIDPALKGTLNVLRSCAKVPSIRPVILTSSMAAVSFNGKPLSPDVTVDETWFSDPAFCEKSKVAWKFSQESRIHMVAINPGLVISPLLQPTLNASVKPVLNIVKGVNIPCETYRWVDVRDVASAHIRAFENPISLNILNFQDKQKRKLPPQTTSLKERNFINA